MAGSKHTKTYIFLAIVESALALLLLLPFVVLGSILGLSILSLGLLALASVTSIRWLSAKSTRLRALVISSGLRTQKQS